MLLELNNVTINIDGNNIVKNIDITIPDENRIEWNWKIHLIKSSIRN